MKTAKQQEGHRQSENRQDVYYHQQAAQCRTHKIRRISRSHRPARIFFAAAHDDTVLIAHQNRYQQHRHGKQPADQHIMLHSFYERQHHRQRHKEYARKQLHTLHQLHHVVATAIFA